MRTSCKSRLAREMRFPGWVGVVSVPVSVPVIPVSLFPISIVHMSALPISTLHISIVPVSIFDIPMIDMEMLRSSVLSGRMRAPSPSGRRGPFEFARCPLPHPPAGLVLEDVVTPAQMCEVRSRRLAAERSVDRVVEITSVHGDAAPGETAVPVARPEKTAHPLTRSIPVHAQDPALGVLSE